MPIGTPLASTIRVASAATTVSGLRLYSYGSEPLLVPYSIVVTIGGQPADPDDVPRWVSGRPAGTVLARIARDVDDGAVLSVDLGVQQ